MGRCKCRQWENLVDVLHPDLFEQQYRYLLAYLLALDAHEGRISPDVGGG